MKHHAEVFDISDRRLQLSPLWGTGKVEDIGPDFPQEESHYHIKWIDNGVIEEYDTIVTSIVPNQKFAYRLTSRREPRATWTVQDVPTGTRLIYLEEFLVDDTGEEDFVQSVRKVVKDWLGNTKRYAEPREGRWQLYAKWAIDRYLLPLRVDQRRVIFLLLVWQMVSCLGAGAGLEHGQVTGIYVILSIDCSAKKEQSTSDKPYAYDYTPKFTPVSSSETSQSLAATSLSCDASLDFTFFGYPRCSMNPSGPM